MNVEQLRRRGYKLNNQSNETPLFDLVFVIVNIGKASKVLAEAKKKGVSGGTITLARGTVNSGLLRKLGLLEVRKEVLLMVTKRSNTLPVIDHINELFHLDQPNRGIIFSTPLSHIVGTQGERLNLLENSLPQESDYELFISIVAEDKGEDVVDVVKQTAGTGGTLLHGLGAFAETVIKVFGIELNSEKDIVLNLVEKKMADIVEKSLIEQLPFHEKDFGIFFSVDAMFVKGIYQRKK